MLFFCQNIRANSDTVRLRICDILHKFLELLNKSANGELEDTLIKRMQIKLIERNRDSHPDVQKAAIRASSILQFPREKFCPIISSFVYLLKHDSLPDVKLLVMNLIGINNLTYGLFTSELIFSVDPLISNKAISVIEKKVPIRLINVKLRKTLFIRLIQNSNDELLEKFVLKCLTIEQTQRGDTSVISRECVNFIRDLDLESSWYLITDYKNLGRNFFRTSK